MTTYEFCHNSKQWILFMMDAPKNCPKHQEHLLNCQDCGYCELRELTNYARRKLIKIEEYK